ncbi:isoamylase, starch debranching enzyme [Haematococcus lacustris]
MRIGSRTGKGALSRAPSDVRSTSVVLRGCSTTFLRHPALDCSIIAAGGVLRAQGVHPWALKPSRQRALVAVAAAPAVVGTALYRSVTSGKPEPLGPSKQGGAINFALYAKFAKAVTLVLFDSENRFITELPLSSKTGDVWHIALEGLPGSGITYGYKVAGDGGWETGLRWYPQRVLVDPYAPLLSGRRVFGQRDPVEQFRPKEGSQFLGTFDFDSPAFDWGPAEASRSRHALKDLVIYEMPVRSFTASPSSQLPEGQRGTFLGLANKAQYLADLGITAVELLPVFEWDELEFQRLRNPREHMVNIWGYSHINFFAPMSRFAADGAGPVAAAREFKQMVKTLHAAGIDVLLDVVYNHTVEGDDKDPYVISFRGIENKTYYMTDVTKPVQIMNFSGCGNTVSANHPVVMKMIIDSLVNWVTEYHVDGFRFDLASCLCRDPLGQPLPAPPLIREISRHPILRQVHLIAEPWDLGMYQVGSFPNWDIWAEWNGRYRDDLRRFLKGDAGMKGALATRLAGSADLYHNHNRKPFHSINFITAHDGFSLYDLVSYNGKHNEANGEGNRDGTNDNFSWNCGAEGPTSDPGIIALRQRQQRNMLLALMVSQGTPMMVMGDECMFTHNGNNNWYGHDQPWTHLPWHLNQQQQDLLRFTSLLVKLRKEHPALGRDSFMSSSDITWHEHNWANDESRFLAFTLHDKSGRMGDLYAAFNAHSFQVEASLPAPPPGRRWCRLVDTNLPPPRDFTPGGNNGVEPKYGVQAYSSILLIAKSN